MDLVRSSGALVALEAASCSRGRDGGQAAHRHRHGRRRLHQPHVPHTGLRDALLCQERLVRSALQKFHGWLKSQIKIFKAMIFSLTYFCAIGKPGLSSTALL